MKTLIQLCFFLFAIPFIAFSQAPQAINYQAVVRDASGKELPNDTKINLTFTIQSAGVDIFTETHSSVSTKLGLCNVQIGLKNPDGFKKIPWSALTTKKLVVEIDFDKNGLIDLITETELASVPYALFAQSTVERQTLKIDGSTLSILDQDGKEVNKVTLPSASYNAGSNINITKDVQGKETINAIVPEYKGGANVTVNNDKTIDATPKLVLTGGNKLSISNSPNSEVTLPSANPTLALSANQLSISGGNTVTLPTGTTYSAGKNIQIQSNNSIDATPSLFLAGNQLSISNGNSVTLPSAAPTLSLTGNLLSITGGSSVTLPSYTAGTNVSISPSNVISAAPQLSITGNDISISGGNKVTIPTTKYTAGTNVNISASNVVSAVPQLSIVGNDISISGGNKIAQQWKFQNGNYYFTSGTNNPLSGANMDVDEGIWTSDGTKAFTYLGENLVNAGSLFTYSPTGKTLVVADQLKDKPENAYLGVGNTQEIDLYIDSNNQPRFDISKNGAINVEASIQISTQGTPVFYLNNGLKQFRVPHPLDETKDIRYTCIEGPEAAMYVRGTVKLINGKAKVELPEHFRLVAGNKNVTVMLTPLSSDSEGLAVVRKSKDFVEIVELRKGTGNYEVDYEIKAVRKDFEDNYQIIGTREKQSKIAGSSKKYIAQPNTTTTDQK